MRKYTYLFINATAGVGFWKKDGNSSMEARQEGNSGFSSF
jgi:hypothetical protein